MSNRVYYLPLLVASLQGYSPIMKQSSMAKTPLATKPSLWPKQGYKEDDVSHSVRRNCRWGEPEKMTPNSMCGSIQFQSNH